MEPLPGLKKDAIAGFRREDAVIESCCAGSRSTIGHWGGHPLKNAIRTVPVEWPTTSTTPPRGR